jgi:hypothetical protein
MYKIFGLILLAITLILCVSIYQDFAIMHYGKKIEVRVIDIPVSCDSSYKSFKPYFRFRYKGKEYTKNIKGSYCGSLKPDDLITLKTDEDYSSFVYVEETLTMEYLVVIFLGIMSLIIMKKK